MSFFANYPPTADLSILLTSIDSKLTSPLVITGGLTDAELRASPVPISVSSLPLPAGAATAANLNTANTYLASIDTKLTSPLNVVGGLTDAQLRASAIPISGSVFILNFPATQPISAVNLPLPVGAATSANQTTANASLSSIDSKLTSPLIVTGGLTDTQLRASPVPISGNMTVSNFPATTAVTQSTTPWVTDGSATTQPISATSLPLPAGAATASNQITANASLSSIDSKLTSPLTVTGPLTDTQLRTSSVAVSGPVTDVQLRATPVPISGTVTANQGTNPWINNITQFGGTALVTGVGASGLGIPRITVSNDSNILATQSGTWNINNILGTVSLPTGAATAANQTSEISAIQTTQPRKIQDGAGNALTSQVNGAQRALDIGIDVAGVQIDPRQVRVLTSTDVVSSNTRDGIGQAITSSAFNAGANLKNALDVRTITPSSSRYAAAFSLRQTAASAANTTVFSMRNAAASTKVVFIEKMIFNMSFNATAPVARTNLSYIMQRFNTATPTGGTVIVVGKMDADDAATSVTDVRFLNTGLTVAGVVFETGVQALIYSPNSGTAVSNYTDDAVGIKLKAGEGLAMLLGAAAIIGQEIGGVIVWSEK